MNLVVPGRDVTPWIDEKTSIHRTIWRDLQRKRTDVEPQSVPPRDIAERCKRRILVLRHDRPHEGFAPSFKDVRHLRRLNVVRATRFCLTDQLCRGVKIGGRRPPGAHLNEGDPEGRGC